MQDMFEIFWEAGVPPKEQLNPTKLKNATFANGKNEGDIYIYRTTRPVPDQIQGCVKIVPTTSTPATVQIQQGSAKVYLKNGTVLQGDIEESDASHIKLKTAYGVLYIKSSDIKNVQKE